MNFEIFENTFTIQYLRTFASKETEFPFLAPKYQERDSERVKKSIFLRGVVLRTLSKIEDGVSCENS